MTLDWRKPIPDMEVMADALASTLDSEGHLDDAAVVRRLMHIIRSRAGNAKNAEDAAWISFAATAPPGYPDPEQRAEYADHMMAEYRKRFAGEES